MTSIDNGKKKGMYNAIKGPNVELDGCVMSEGWRGGGE